MKLLALDIGGSKLVCAVVNEDGTVLERIRAELPAGYGAEELWSIIEKCVTALPFAECSAAGATIPGLADPENGIWVYAPFSGIADFDIAARITGLTGLPVGIENDVNACAVGEKRFGVCRDVDDFIWITVSNGIGGAIYAGGKLYSGSSGNAGEFGHINVCDEDGRKCGCGNRGCLEAEAAGPAISAEFELRTGRRLSAKAIAELALDGDSSAIEVYKRAGYLIGSALAAAVNLLNPKLAVFGGGVSNDFDLFSPSIEEALALYMFGRANKDFKAVHTGLGYDAALLGAAALAINKMQ